MIRGRGRWFAVAILLFAAAARAAEPEGGASDAPADPVPVLPPLVALSTAPFPVMVEYGKEVLVRVRITGRLQRPGWTLHYEGKKIAETGESVESAEFGFDLPVTGPETVVPLSAEGPDGESLVKQFKIKFGDWEKVHSRSGEVRSKMENELQKKDFTPEGQKIRGLKFDRVRFPARIYSRGEKVEARAIMVGSYTRPGSALMWDEKTIVACPASAAVAPIQFEVPIHGEATPLRMSVVDCGSKAVERGAYTVVFPAWRELSGTGGGRAVVAEDEWVREVVEGYSARQRDRAKWGEFSLGYFLRASSLVATDTVNVAKVSLGNSSESGFALSWARHLYRAWSIRARIEMISLTRKPPAGYTLESNATSFMNFWVGFENDFLPNLVLAPFIAFPEYEVLTSFSDIVIRVQKVRAPTAGLGLRYRVWKGEKMELGLRGTLMVGQPTGAVSSIFGFGAGFDLDYRFSPTRRITGFLRNETINVVSTNTSQQIKMNAYGLAYGMRF